MVSKTFQIITSYDLNDFRYFYLSKHLNEFLRQHGWVQDTVAPRYVFVIGDSKWDEAIPGKNFRIIFLSDVSDYYCDIANMQKSYLIIRDIDTNVTIPSRNFTQVVSYPLPNCCRKKRSLTSLNRIFVSCQGGLFNKATNLKLLRPLNKISNIQILIDGSPEIMKDCINENISFVDSGNNMSDIVKHSDLVIGSGIAIIEALLQGKNFIIAGANGYGGIPDKRNLFRFSETFFQGAIGGHLYDPIPESLILDDIISIETGSVGTLSSNTIKELSLGIFNEWANSVSFLERKEKYMFNTDFTIIMQFGHYYILNRYDRKKILDISPHDASAISENRFDDIEKGVIENLIKKRILIFK